MRSFASKLLRVTQDGAQTLGPVRFSGRMDELTLEKHIVDDPELMGEPLFVLGRQLAEFEEDKDRLDILAVDKDGEIVVIELKVTEDFRVTDLQALAYAGAYADLDIEDLAETRRRYMKKMLEQEAAEAAEAAAAEAAGAAASSSGDEANASGGETNGSHASVPEPAATSDTLSVDIDEAKAKIVEFLELDDFDSWEPSQRVRIKLVAPSFPRRVLKNVKHWGDVYGMPVEAISARLFETPDHHRVVSFERLLPLPGDDEFDMTRRRREERRRDENVQRARRPKVVPTLLEAGKLTDGQTLYLHKTVLPKGNRDRFDPDKQVFQVILRKEDGGPGAKFEWQPDDETPAKTLSPSTVPYEVYKAVLPDWNGEAFNFPVATSFTVEPNGKTLEEIALDEGLWSPIEAAE
jgi:hypothetical protein